MCNSRVRGKANFWLRMRCDSRPLTGQGSSDSRSLPRALMHDDGLRLQHRSDDHHARLLRSLERLPAREKKSSDLTMLPNILAEQPNTTAGMAAQ